MYGIALTIALFFFFILLAAIRDKYGKKHPLFKLAVVPFILFDIGYNLTIATVLFLDRPKFETLSNRLHRYIRTDVGWRNRLAEWFCRTLIERIDPGHCR